MKKNDLLAIIIAGVVAGIFSLVASNILFTPNDKKQLTAQKVSPLDSKFEKPDPRYFNPDGINPTQLIQIGDNLNPQPF